MYFHIIKQLENKDIDLVLSYKRDKNNAILGVLFQKYTHLVLGVCMKYLQNEELSKDAVMDVFEMLPKLLQKHEISNFKSWLHSVAKNHCLMQLRKQKGILEFDSLDKIEHSLMENEEEKHLSNEKEIELQKMEKGLETLSKEQKQCISLFYLKEKSYLEVVEETGFELKKVKSYIQNGKRNLKLYLINNKTGIIITILLQIF